MISDSRKPTVVLLHGLGRTAGSLVLLRRHLERAGYRTWSRSYPSRSRGVAALTDTVESTIRWDLDLAPGEELAHGSPLFAVTHSPGGILFRHLADRFPWERAVMLAPPNRGSRVARDLQDTWAFRTFMGPAARELGRAGSPGRPDWPVPVCPVGVIAGTRGATWTNPISWIAKVRTVLPREPHDGTLLRRETQEDWLADFAEVDASHTLIMNHPRARMLTLRFLQGGAFRE